MLFLFTILVVLSAVALYAAFGRRRESNLLEENPPKNFAAENYRPLFEPTDHEIRAFAREENERQQAKRAEEARRILAGKVEKLAELQKHWSASPDKEKTIELIFQAAATESAKTFREISENVLKSWRENRIANLSARDLADLLDSHFRILPQQERTSGATFWLREEIEALRSQSEEIS